LCSSSYLFEYPSNKMQHRLSSGPSSPIFSEVGIF